jgi:hypothetical protein
MMDIKSKFLELTSHTYPHGKEHLIFDKLPQDLEMDEFGNLYKKIGDSDVMFTSHLDTATSAFTPVNHLINENFIKTDGSSILGADDKAGLVIMLYMIENKVPGLYYFFIGEEVGCVGSRKVAANHQTEKLPYINKVISFDRRGTDSVITFQGGSRCASEEFAQSLSKELNIQKSGFNYKPDPTGIYTDSAQFVKIYPECTNISVGYYNEHTTSERQDITHLIDLAEACIKVDWNSLPVKRDTTKDEWSYETHGGYGRWGMGSGWSYDDEDWGIGGGSGYSKYGSIGPAKPSTKKVSFFDDEFNHNSSFDIDSKTLEVVSVNLHKDRILEEEAIIYDFLNLEPPHGIGLQYETMSWDGLTLTVTYKDRPASKAKREDFKEYLPEISIKRYIYGFEEL